MASNFPINLDLMTPDPQAEDACLGHADLHTLVNDAIRNIQTKLGIDGSMVSGTIDYLLKTASNPGHTHTPNNVGLSNVTNNKQIKALGSATSGKLLQFSGTSGDTISEGPGYGETGNNVLVQTDANGLINQSVVPGGITGEIKIWTTNTPPTGWKICDGSAISRTTYASLFAIIGTTYGVGDGSTTFNIPNLKGKVVVGFNSSETEFDALGETGGEKTHTLTTNEIPSHNHTWTTYDGTGAGTNPYAAPNGVSTTHTWNTSSIGGGLAHNNLQPYIALNYIIKY